MFCVKPKTFGLQICDTCVKAAMPPVFEMAKLKPGVVKDGEIKNEEELSKTIKKLLSKAKIKAKYVIASLPEEKSFFQIIQMPKMKEIELRQAVSFEAENYIPLPADQMCLDYQIVLPMADHLDHLDVMIAASPKKTVESYVSCLKKAGLVPYVFEIESHALSRALIKKGKSDSPVILLNFSETNTNMAVFSGYSVRFTCSLPAGILNLLTDRDMKSFCLNIEKYIDFYKTHASHEHLEKGKEKIEKIIICCKDCPKSLRDALEKQLKLPAQPADIDEKYRAYAVPMGLAKYYD